MWRDLRFSLLFWLLPFLANVSRFGSIVVLGDPIFANVSRLGVVAGQGTGLGGNNVSQARAPNWVKLIKLPRREHEGAVPSPTIILHVEHSLFV